LSEIRFQGIDKTAFGLNRVARIAKQKGDQMSKADIVGAVVILICTVGFAWTISYALRKGRWKYRGGTAYRETSPKLFWGIITCASIMEVFLIVICIVMLNHIFFCGGVGTPKACLARTINMITR
jgi:hypothetical protein